jgi:hypothetical protein
MYIMAQQAQLESEFQSYYAECERMRCVILAAGGGAQAADRYLWKVECAWRGLAPGADMQAATASMLTGAMPLDIVARLLPAPTSSICGTVGEAEPSIREVRAIAAGWLRYCHMPHEGALPLSPAIVTLADPAVNPLIANPPAANDGLIEFSQSNVAPSIRTNPIGPLRTSALRPRIWKDEARNPQAVGSVSINRWSSMSITTVADEMLKHYPARAGKVGTGPVRGGWGNAMRQRLRSTVMLATKVFADRPQASLVQADYLQFAELLAELPKIHHRSAIDRASTLQEIIERAKERGETATIGTGAARHVATLRGLHDFLAARCSVPPINWGEFGSAPRPKFPRSYTRDEATRFFTTPIYTGRSGGATRHLLSGDTVYHNAGFWVPLLLGHGGQRSNEVGGALISDVRQLNGIWYLAIRPNRLRGLKTPAATRDVPLHPEILRLGFLDYVEARQQAGDEALFPELLTASRRAPSGTFHSMFARPLVEYLGEDYALRGVAALRGYVASELKFAFMPITSTRALLGHRGESNPPLDSAAHIELMMGLIAVLPALTSHLTPLPINLMKPKAPRDRRSIARNQDECDN